MRKLYKNENGFTLVETLSALVILGILGGGIIGICLQIMSISTLQSKKIEFQQISNNIVLEMEKISQIDGLYEQAGYLGKYVGVPWNDAHIIKVLNTAGALEEIDKMAEGAHQIGLTHINDNLNQTITYFGIKDDTIKIKIFQNKNEHDVTKTIYSLPNYRDSFSIQTTALIIFYQDQIAFSQYYNTHTGLWNFNDLSTLENVLYARKTTFTYRDNSKARGDVPGSGKW
ncbi:prepilin-type N-terminal cleavage/methylation domain-containing protein [Enterococcus sp.]|uniref:prepilin-type N-terminal cleavage/methylation domain-containing protein n=1 Tax=Enterococcus sp. TaxID=35783 RepID=UPI00289A60D2|nr:prepilin-type N-terminal cleavage/methylation domain-containing protein [Enterococcus sp.]